MRYLSLPLHVLIFLTCASIFACTSVDAASEKTTAKWTKKLFNALQSNNVPLVIKSIKKGADVNSKNEQKATPLHLAARYCDWMTVHTLLKYKAKINAETGAGETPLHWATDRKDRGQNVSLLLHAGANADTKTNDYATPLNWAAGEGNTEAVALLLKYGSDINTYDKDEMTPLHDAAESGHTETVAVLIKNKANINACDNNGDTPLHLAIKSGHAPTSRALLQYGADIYAKNKQGLTPIQNGKAGKLINLLTVIAALDDQKPRNFTEIEKAMQEKHLSPNEAITYLFHLYHYNQSLFDQLLPNDTYKNNALNHAIRRYNIKIALYLLGSLDPNNTEHRKVIDKAYEGAKREDKTQLALAIKNYQLTVRTLGGTPKNTQQTQLPEEITQHIAQFINFQTVRALKKRNWCAIL